VQRLAFLALFGLEDATVDAPDLVPEDVDVLAAKEKVTAEIERRIFERPSAEWLERLARAGVPAGPGHARGSVHADPPVGAGGLVAGVEQPGLGAPRPLAPTLSPHPRSPP